jgi:hypothetical protein
MKELDMEAVGSILMSMPDVQESTMHGHRSFKVRGKLLACPAIHKTAEPNSLVVKIPADERDQLLADKPHVYYIADHYSKSAVVLVRLSEIDPMSLRSLLERACCLLSPSQPIPGASPRKARRALNAAAKKGPTKRSGGSPRKRGSR